MFELTKSEVNEIKDSLRSQSVISTSLSTGYMPFAFTEHDVAMLASVLRSPKAIEVNIQIMRTFVRLRRLLATNSELARKLEDIELKYDSQFRVIFDAIRALMREPEKPNRKIGFTTKEQRVAYSTGQEKQ